MGWLFDDLSGCIHRKTKRIRWEADAMMIAGSYTPFKGGGGLNTFVGNGLALQDVYRRLWSTHYG